MLIQRIALNLKATIIVTIFLFANLFVANGVNATDTVAPSSSPSVAPLFSNQISDSWVAKAPISAAVGGSGAAVVNGTIYVMGKTYTYAYDPVNNTWTSLAPMPTPRDNFGEAAYGNKIYVIGGSTGESEYSSSINEAYDVATNSWSSMAPMPTAIREMNAAVANGKIYVMGGRTGGAYSTVNVTEAYDPINNSWNVVAAMLYPVVAYASAVVGDKIYVIGGQDEWYGFQGMIGLGTPAPPPSSYPPLSVAFTQIYNTATDSWSLGASVPTVVFGSAAGATSGVLAPARIYVLGGVGDSFEASNRNVVYDPVANSWSFAASLPNATSGEVVAVVNDVLYCIGGGTGQIYLGNTWQYTPIGYQLPPSPSSTPSATPLTTEAYGNSTGSGTQPRANWLEIAIVAVVALSISVTLAAIIMSRRKLKPT